MTFWDHLEALRGSLLRMGAVLLVFSIATFCCKDLLFQIVFAPQQADFATYRLLSRLVGPIPEVQVSMINTELTQQFLTHMKVALGAGLLLTSPYLIFEIFAFITPALHRKERRVLAVVSAGGYVMFMLGVALSYFLIFPLTYRFLGGYQVSESVANMISLNSYVSTLLVLCLIMGIVFELPVVSGLLAKMGLLKADFMAKYRRHAVVLILIVAAIITPTADAITLLVVSLPIYLLYELSILIVRRLQG